jgi:hypothetical protein
VQLLGLRGLGCMKSEKQEEMAEKTRGSPHN